MVSALLVALIACLACLGWLAFSVVRQRRALDRARREREELEQRCSVLEERVSAHANELEVAVELAHAASRAKSEFLANMSHEIRTPLNAVIGLTEVVLDAELSEFQRDHLRTVLDSGEVLLNIINDVLDFSKIEAGKMQLERVAFSPEEAIFDTLKSQAIRAQGKGLELACMLDPNVPRVIMGDPGRLRQVVANLVSNAITYTEQGQVFVRVTYDPECSRLQVAVLDSGIGIDPKQLGQLFDSFQQADSSTTRRYGGTGLGLAISKELVGLMGGEIHAESEPGVGSSFSFYLPCDVSPEGEEALRREEALAAPLAGTRVLIVDDNLTHRTILDAVARSHGMRPVLTPSAADAFAVLCGSRERGDPILLVVSDVQMPDADGFALAEWIRATPELDDVALALLTSAVKDADDQRCARLRVDARLMKPVKPTELIETLVEIVTGVAGEAAAAPVVELAGTAPARQPEDRAVSGLRILLVEDSAPNRKLAEAILSGQHHHLTIAENGREALDAYVSGEFDVVLMDVQMPQMDGLQATAAIRAAEAAACTEDGTARHVPIIAMTANALSGDREKCLAAGMDDYLAKPIRRGEMLEALRRAVGSPPGVVDWSGPLDQVDGNREVLREIVQAYVGEIRENLQLLPECISKEDWREIRRRAHTLKGAMRMFGAARAQELGQQLESQALSESESADSMRELCERLEDSVGQMLPELAWFAETGELGVRRFGEG